MNRQSIIVDEQYNFIGSPSQKMDYDKIIRTCYKSRAATYEAIDMLCKVCHLDKSNFVVKDAPIYRQEGFDNEDDYMSFIHYCG